MNKHFTLLSGLLLVGSNALAQTAADPHAGHHSTAPAASVASAPASEATAMPWVNAEVRKVDLAQGKVTLRHEALPNLDMPPMTMVFRAPAPALNGLQAGDKVRFIADKQGGNYLATQIEKITP